MNADNFLFYYYLLPLLLFIVLKARSRHRRSQNFEQIKRKMTATGEKFGLKYSLYGNGLNSIRDVPEFAQQSKLAQKIMLMSPMKRSQLPFREIPKIQLFQQTHNVDMKSNHYLEGSINKFKFTCFYYYVTSDNRSNRVSYLVILTPIPSTQYVPVFCLAHESLIKYLLFSREDIDFSMAPEFSKKYHLYGIIKIISLPTST